MGASAMYDLSKLDPAKIDEPTDTPPVTTDLTPTPKVLAGTMAGAVASLICWLLSSNGVDVPAEQAVAMSTVVSFVLSWVTSNK